VISGWFYRKPGELEEEKLQQEADGLTEFIPILVKTIVKDQLDILYEEAGKLDVL